MTADHVRALRYARDLVSDMRWQGVAVPPLYARMAGEFQDLVRTGDYAAWVADGGSHQTRAVRRAGPAP